MMPLADLLVAAPILGLAAWLLHRSLFRGKSGCHGCSGESCRRPPPEPSLVRLRGGRR